jgi:chromosomal replication initiation ATPase DnaA
MNRTGSKIGDAGKDCTMAFATSPATALNPWLQILAALEKKVIRQSFETWLKPTRYSHAAGRTLYVRVPSPEFQHIGDKYGDLIQEAIDLQSLEFDDVSFVTAEEDPSIPPQRKDGGFGPVPAHAPTAPPPPRAARTPEQAASTGPPPRSSTSATPSTPSSSATATSLRAPPRWPWPSGPRAPTIRSSSMAASAWARPT